MTNAIRSRLPYWGLLLLVAIAWLPSTGCNRNPLGRVPISGKVNFEGKPLDKGTIDFRPFAGEKSVSSGAAIADGVYEIANLKGLPPGRYEVRIFSSKEDMSPPPEGVRPGGMRPGIERLPPRFNVQSTQIVEVTAAGPNQFNFDIPAK